MPQWPPCGLGIRVRWDQLTSLGISPVAKICCMMVIRVSQLLWKGIGGSPLSEEEEEGGGQGTLLYTKP
jgi:hypothetical protein